MPTELTESGLLLTHKPPGISTHRANEQQMAFVEWSQRLTQKQLKVVHRLDKDTSGAMVFAEDSQAAAELTELFTQRQVKKEYWLLSPIQSQWDQWVVAEEKGKGTLVKECPWQGEGNHFASLTKFQRISTRGPFYLYKAWPQTGKTHQVRKHATHSEIPILGDEIYGGEKFPRLMLHCYQMQWDWRGERITHQVPASRLFSHPEECQDPQWAQWVIALERRQVLFPQLWQTEEALRLMHRETGDLRGDQVGRRVVLGWWQSQPPSSSERQKMKKLMQTFGFEDWVFQWRPGAQKPESTAVLDQSSSDVELDWVFQENGVRYRGRLDQGQNFGLFLDQRERRAWVREKANGARVLNLFAFTCGFSLNAALGGASQVVSVDLYPRYLQWGKENFQLNDLDPEAVTYQWRAMGSLEYLKFAQKKGLQFDIIVCDPPSFSRAKKGKGVFRVERDYQGLLQGCLRVLSPEGSLLFSNNYEKWSLEKWQERLSPLARLQTSPSQWDYEWQNYDANLKAFFLFKA